MKRIAIIGAGISGLTLAHYLKGLADIAIFEKSHGVSGRMSARYSDPYQFDHGAQYFTVRSEPFKAFLEPHLRSGVVQIWEPKVVALEKGKSPDEIQLDSPHVATPKMNDLCKKLAEPWKVYTRTEIAALEHDGSLWQLRTKENEIIGLFDWVVSTAPAPQSARLLPECFIHQKILQKVRMTGCYSLMLGYNEALPLHWDAALVKASALGWIAVNSSKPERKSDFSLLLQSTNAWAEEHMDFDIPHVQSMLVEELKELLELDLSCCAQISTHRWHYADTAIPAGNPYLLDDANHLAACGDWCIKGRVEAAFTSAYELSRGLKAIL